MLLALNKPYGVLSQFTPEPGSRWCSLADISAPAPLPPRVYPVGRLDADSEGLLLLTDERALVDRLLNPARAHAREYFAQVENIPEPGALARLARGGIVIGGHRALPCRAELIDPASPEVAAIPPRDPPIRVRKNIPDAWLSLELTEGKNRQVRRMTAAVGHPTLRLVRVRIGALRLAALGLAPGEWRELTTAGREACFS
ncbi:23S rRNA pseudouridine2457 synthase [Ereboglobus sp. PH5-5]|uniref:pseudouridine synthase n=1 Tax=Ereboglobus sp. PH5-5 TaxID=2940529 RepID=UPI002405ABC9|nr:pseudouridine synthase [Ereboglobus sp. PH5-5]MDF9831847.1 23S rRNA pseudouridine2457 synthase [Ereboglobus sp. PH5-5]